MERVGQKQLASIAERIEQAQARVGDRTPTYTVVLHEAKTKLGITVTEYVLADSVNKLSGKHSATPGWCHASKGHMAKILGVSERSVFSLLSSLRKSGVVEQHPQHPGLLRTSALWEDTVEVLRGRLYNKR